jgi:hypothetical protein
VVERTTFGGKLRLCLRRSDLLKISRPVWSEKTRWGKQWGKHLGAQRKARFALVLLLQIRAFSDGQHSG